MTWRRSLNIYYLIDIIINFEQVGVCLFAYFTFKHFPVHTCQIRTVFLLHFGCEPTFQTLIVNKSDWTWALARYNARILDSWIWAPAKSTTCLSRVGRVNSLDVLGFFQLLSQKLFWSWIHLFAYEILDSKLDSSKFYHIKLPYLVILLIIDKKTS
jgi:hypothetical protein